MTYVFAVTAICVIAAFVVWARRGDWHFLAFLAIINAVLLNVMAQP